VNELNRWPNSWGQIIPNGDTIEVLHGNNPERICLNGIDCSEKHQAYGTRAEQATSERVFRSFHNHLFLNRLKDRPKHSGNRPTLLTISKGGY